MCSRENKWLYRATIIAVWLILWQLISMWVDNSILLVGPLATLRILLEKIAELSFWQSIFGSLLRIVAGFLQDGYWDFCWRLSAEVGTGLKI